MKEFILTEQESERTVLVGLVTPQQNEAKVNEYLDELAFLAFFDTQNAVENQSREHNEHREARNRKAGINARRHQKCEGPKIVCLDKMLECARAERQIN